MREFAGPPLTSPPPTATLVDAVVARGTEQPDRPGFTVRRGDQLVTITTAEFLDSVQAVAKGMLDAGIEAGDRVVLLARPRYEWALFDFALWYVGAVSVPIYDSASADQIKTILSDCGASAAIVEHTGQVSQVIAAGDMLADREAVWCIEDGAVEELTRRGSRVTDDELEARNKAVTSQSLATVVYTSGVTGQPKGCMLTHANLLCEVTAAVTQLGELFDDEKSATVLFLPMAHVFARIVEVGAVHAGVRLSFSPGIKQLMTDLETYRPTFLLAVPRVFEKLLNTATQQAAADGRGRRFEKAVEVAIDYSRSLDGAGPGPVLKARHTLFDRTVYRRFRDRLGGRCTYAIAGGAPLGERLGHFYRGVGIPVLEGYGLTETTAAVAVNTPEAHKIGTAGRPLPGTAVRISDEGELLVSGSQVFAGYWGERSSDTCAVDGWLRTGDLGEIDEEGFVRIAGRRKEILVTAGGKNVAPEVLEDRVRVHPLVDQCMVVGDGRPFVAALLTLEAESVEHWAREHGHLGKDEAFEEARDRLLGLPALRDELQAAVDHANAAVSQAESIREFKVLREPWTEERGQLSPSLKLRRHVIEREFRRAIEDIYAR